MLVCCLQVLEELVNKRLSKDIRALYSTKVICRIRLARLQLILAMCSTIHDLPEPLTGILIVQQCKGDLLSQCMLVVFQFTQIYKRQV